MESQVSEESLMEIQADKYFDIVIWFLRAIFALGTLSSIVVAIRESEFHAFIAGMILTIVIMFLTCMISALMYLVFVL